MKHKSLRPRGPLSWWQSLSPKSQDMTMLGVVWICIGYGVLTGANVIIPGAFHTTISSDIRGTIWILTGVFALIAAVTRWHKDLACGLLVLMPLLRVASYLVAWLFWLIPGGPVGIQDAWYQAVFQFVLVLIVWRTSTLGVVADLEEDV